MMSGILTSGLLLANLRGMRAADALRHLGLTTKETMIYLALLEIGDSTVLQISKKTGVKRPTAYLTLGALESKGFVSRVMRRGKLFFSPQHPKKLLTEAELRLQEIKESVPLLEAMLSQKDERPRVMIFEGKDALDRAYDDYFIKKGEINFFTNVDVVYDAFERTDAKLKYVSSSPEYRVREVVLPSEKAIPYIKRVVGPNREARLMPEFVTAFVMDIGVFSNTTLITSAKQEYFTVKIESAEIAQSFRILFEAMWRLSQEATS